MIFIRLNQIFKTVFPPWTAEKQFDANLIDQYPLLFGVYRDIDGNYAFQRFIEGSTKRPDVNEFLSELMTFKDKFADSEQKMEKAKVLEFITLQTEIFSSVCRKTLNNKC